MKLIHVTDTHLIHPGKTLHGLDPEVRFEACMEDIILNHSDADCLLILSLIHISEPTRPC